MRCLSQQTIAQKIGQVDGANKEEAWFHKMNRESLDRLKKNRPTLDEMKESMQLDKILDSCMAAEKKQGLYPEVLESLKVQLLLWKHDELPHH